VSLTVAGDPASEELPGVHCWNGLLDADRAGTIPAMRQVLARAIASGDDLLADYVADRLAEIVGGDVARAGELLDWGDQVSGKELEVILQAIARTTAVQDRASAARLLRAGEDATKGEVGRAAALAALETQQRLPDEDLQRLAKIALEPDGGGAAWTATRTVGRVMKEDFTRTGRYEPYWDQLLAIGSQTTDPAVRILALEMPAYVDPVLGDEYIDDLARVLTTAPEKEVREMAAFQLGLTKSPDRALAVFRDAFAREPEVCVRWAMVRFSVRAAGRRALPVLDDMARIDRRFRVDLEDFRRIYATGVEDFERIWLEKAEHHPCTADGDEEGGA
jgi:hypothetical protein